MQRILTEGTQIPAPAINFLEPLRTKTGTRAQGSQLRNLLSGAVGVAVKEFESWLIADAKAIGQVIDNVHHDCQAPETLACGEAKQTLQKWSKDMTHPSRHLLDIRRELANVMNLDVVANVCPSFKAFRQALHH